MACQMVLPAKSLGTVLAKEVLSARMDHHVPSHILPCVETTVTVVTRVFLLLGATRGLPRVALEMLQEHRRTLIGLHAHFTGEIPRCGRVHGHVALISQLGVIVLPTLLTLEGLLVGVMGLQVVLQVVFSVKHFLTERALMGFLWRVCGHMPAEEHKKKENKWWGCFQPVKLLVSLYTQKSHSEPKMRFETTSCDSLDSKQT